MTRKGRVYGEFNVEHPVTYDEYTVHAYIDYVDEEDTNDTQGSLDWDYTIQWVKDEEDKVVTDISWITYKLIEQDLEQILINEL